MSTSPAARPLSWLAELTTRHPRVGYLIAFAAGVAVAGSFAPLAIWPLALLGPMVLILLWDDAAPRRAAALGFWFNAGTFSVGTYWLYISIAGFGGAPAWLALVLMLGLVAIMGAYHAALGYAVARWLPARGALRWMLGIPAAWLLVEWFRSWFLTGFGWLALGYSQLDTWLASFAPLGGLYLISGLLLVMAGAIVTLLRSARLTTWYAWAAIVLPWLAGWALQRIEWTQRAGAPLSFAVVQGAIPQDEKWITENLAATRERYQELTVAAHGADVIVWPESAIPDLVNNYTDYLVEINRKAAQHGSALMLGAIRASDDGENYYNSVLAIDREVGWYNKHHLVPFAEFFPVPAFVRRWLRLMNLPYSDFTAGDARQAPLVVADQKIAASICYEDAYGSTHLPLMREATLLVNVTNDAWFGRSSARYQHLQIARFRALETGRFMVRAANDGVSAVIDSRGRVVATAPEYVPYVLKASAQPLAGLTPYARVGDWFAVTAALLALGAAIALRSSQRPRGPRADPDPQAGTAPA
jgi:apolipoprotein N-acyltransferase